MARYASVDGADVAFEVVGDGDLDLVYSYGLGSHLELLQLTPGWNEFLERLTRFSRVILFDRRGTGGSDALSDRGIPPVEEWAQDIRSVLDAAGSARAAIIASLDAGPAAVLFAATHPERVSSLVLLNTTARYLVGEDYPIGRSPEDVTVLLEVIAATWGTEDFIRFVSPDAAGDPGFRAEAARWLRFSATPRSAAAQYEYLFREVDVRGALGAVQAPTLVLHVEESGILPLSHGRYLADSVPEAQFRPIAGGSLSMTPNLETVFDELAEFLTGHRGGAAMQRVLRTIVFTDIVGSTETAASLGDERWRALLDAHDRAVRAELERFRGTEVKTLGDGFLAAFDGPGRAVKFCRAAADAVRPLGIELRAGVHTGEVEKRGDDLAGLGVHIAARIGAMAGASEVLTSSTVRDLVVGSDIEFGDRGSHELKGVPGTWNVLQALPD